MPRSSGRSQGRGRHPHRPAQSHLFQPLLYQVAMAGLSPADIAAPIRTMLSRYSNVKVLLGEVRSIDLDARCAVADIGEILFDYLILSCGATHSYFGHDEWEEYAPGLKTLEQATEIDAAC